MAKNSPKLVFTEHFQARKDTRNIGEKLVEDFVLNKPNDLIYAEETSSNRGKRRFKLYYVLSKRKVLLLVLDVDETGFFKGRYGIYYRQEITNRGGKKCK